LENRSDFIGILSTLFSEQNLAVLATNHNTQPYTNLVSFAPTKDLRQLLFATTRSTRKYANIIRDSRASMLVDNRSNEAADIHRAVAATAIGVVIELSESESAALKEVYLRKHPHLSEFVRSPSCAFLSLRVSTYYLVRRFQQVTEINIPS
jgi:uncharacterized protein YhbP (UPF0306 family)